MTKADIILDCLIQSPESLSPYRVSYEATHIHNIKDSNHDANANESE